MQIIKICVALVLLTFPSACGSVLPFEISRRDTNTYASDFAPPRGYSRDFSPAAHNFRRATASVGEPVRMGRVSERFELRDGDCDVTDCTKPRARAEIQLSPKANPARVGQDVWYGWSFYNESVPAFTKENSLRLVFGQWTMGGGQRSIFRFIQLGAGESDFTTCDPRICTNPTTAQGDLVVQLDDIASYNRWGRAQNNGYICRLFDLTEQKGKWVDLTVNTNFSTGIDGYLRIWVNGRLACDYSGPLVSPPNARSKRKPEHRRGIFSSWDRRWRTTMEGARKPTLVVYYDEFRIGTYRAEVDVPSRKANSAPPLD